MSTQFSKLEWNINPYRWIKPPLELTPLVFPRSETRGVLIQKSGRRPGKFGDLVWFPHWKTFRNVGFRSIFWFYEHWFQNFSPAALLKLPKYSILIKSPPQAKKILASGRIFELKPPPLVFPRSRTRGGLIQRYGLILWNYCESPYSFSEWIFTLREVDDTPARR